MAAHRYWRLGITCTFAANAQANTYELQMRTSFGGADVCSGGTAFSSSGTAANAFDNNDGTNFETGSFSFPYTHYVGYDFGSGNDKDIVEVAILRGQFEAENFRDFFFQYSDDNATWTTQASIGRMTPFNTALKDYNVIDVTPKTQTGRRYWRFRQTSSISSGSQANIKRIEFRPTSGAPSAMANGVVSASGALSNGARAISSIASNWETSYSGNPAILTYALPAGFKTEVYEVTIQGGSFAAENPKDFKIQYSDDNATWVDAFDHVAPGGWSWAVDEVKTFTMTDNGGSGPPPGVARRRPVIVSA